MLVLTRRADESIVIGGDVIVKVLEVRGDVVRIGIEAPRHVQVHREEVFRELQQANRAASAPSDAALEALEAAVARPDRAIDASGSPGAHGARSRVRRDVPGDA